VRVPAMADHVVRGFQKRGCRPLAASRCQLEPVLRGGMEAGGNQTP
jgi:hypothetical protein